MSGCIAFPLRGVLHPCYCVPMNKAAAALASLAITAAIAYAAPTEANAYYPRPTAEDKAAMAKANLTCKVAKDPALFEACVIGAFTSAQHRYIDDRYLKLDGKDKAHRVVLVRKSTLGVGA